MLTKPLETKHKFVCELCCFKSNVKKDYNTHLLTAKHKMLTDVNECSDEEFIKNNFFICDKCCKIYKSRVGLWKHKKMCSKHVEENDEECNAITSLQQLSNQITPELIMAVLSQNKDLTNLVLEQNKTLMEFAKNGQGNAICNNNNNSNNKTFNLQVFLNETCKDAMNISDFVDSLHLQLSDLENVGKVGFVEGISNIIVKSLQAIEVHKRPVHCADKKREVIYIKDQDKWERDNDQKERLRKVIKTVAYKNEKLLTKYKEEHPGCNFSESKYADQYSKIVIEAMGGIGNNDAEKEDKIIQRIAKEVVIDKKYQTI